MGSLIHGRAVAVWVGYYSSLFSHASQLLFWDSCVSCASFDRLLTYVAFHLLSDMHLAVNAAMHCKLCAAFCGRMAWVAGALCWGNLCDAPGTSMMGLVQSCPVQHLDSLPFCADDRLAVRLGSTSSLSCCPARGHALVQYHTLQYFKRPINHHGVVQHHDGVFCGCTDLRCIADSTAIPVTRARPHLRRSALKR